MTGSKRPFNSPPPAESFGYQSPVAAQPPRPLSSSKRFSVKLYSRLPALVPVLNCSGRPSTVRRPIIAIIIDSIKGVLRCRSWIHISIKRLERISPFITDGYTSPAPSRIISGVFVVASRLHRVPYIVFRRVAKMVRSPLGLLNPQASTRLNPIVFQCRSADSGFIPAITDAIPHCCFPSVWGAVINRKPVKFLACQVYKFWHGILFKLNIRVLSH